MPVLTALLLVLATLLPASAQIAPTEAEWRAYGGLHAAAARGDVAGIEKLIASGENKEAVDRSGRTPLHVAAYLKKHDAARTLIRLGADPNKLEIDRYDIITIAAVANDLPMLGLAIEGGGQLILGNGEVTVTICTDGNVLAPHVLNSTTSASDKQTHATGSES